MFFQSRRGIPVLFKRSLWRIVAGREEVINHTRKRLLNYALTHNLHGLVTVPGLFKAARKGQKGLI